MSPIVGYHATRDACRRSIKRDGLIAMMPTGYRPMGVYVFRDDGSFDHPGFNSKCVWEWEPRQDLWEAAYIGPLMEDEYVLNALIFLENVEHVTLVTGN